MKENKIRVGIIGGFQTGKSTLVNCLLDGKFAQTGGSGIAVTSIPTRYTYGDLQHVQYLTKGKTTRRQRLDEFLNEASVSPDTDEVVISLWKPILQHIDLVDTPGFKATDKDNLTTETAILEIDAAIVLLNNKGLDLKEIEIFKTLHRYRKPFWVLVNCMNTGGELWNPHAEQNLRIVAEIEGRIANIGGNPLPVNGKKTGVCNLLWYWYATGHYREDSTQQAELIETQIDFFTKSFFQHTKDDHHAIAEKSGFGNLRNVFGEEDYCNFPFSFIKWSSIINHSFNQWERKLEQLLKKI